MAGYSVQQKIGRDIYLVRLTVDPGLRRRGVGRILLGAVLAEAGQRGVGRVYLRVRAANSAARALYEYLGFQAIKQHTYPDGGAGVEMVVSLEPDQAEVPTS